MIKTLLDHTFYIDKINDVVIVDLGANDGRFYAECLDHFGATSIKSYIGVEPNKILYDEVPRLSGLHQYISTVPGHLLFPC